MIQGIGVDSVYIPKIAQYLKDERIANSFMQHTFTLGERCAAVLQENQAAYYATRFAAKEAVFKATAHQTAKQKFDFRIVETLNFPDGAPYVNVTPRLRDLMMEAGVANLHISITTEKDYATAFVVAESL